MRSGYLGGNKYPLGICLKPVYENTQMNVSKRLIKAASEPWQADTGSLKMDVVWWPTYMRSRVRENRTHGSVRGAVSNGRPYRVTHILSLY